MGKYKKKTKRGVVALRKRLAETTTAAAMIAGGASIANASRRMGIPYSTVQRRHERIGCKPGLIGRPPREMELRENIRTLASSDGTTKQLSMPKLIELVQAELHEKVPSRSMYTILNERPSWPPSMLMLEPGQRSASRDTLLRLIASARKPIDVSVYIFTSQELADALVKLAEEGVKVRVLTDATEARNIYSQVNYLRRNGVKVCLGNTTMHHHKTVIIDKNCRLNGSMNWSRAGLESNKENIEISYRQESEADEIRHKIYVGSFERKWEKNFRRYARLIVTDDAELIVLLTDDETDAAA